MPRRLVNKLKLHVDLYVHVFSEELKLCIMQTCKFQFEAVYILTWKCVPEGIEAVYI